MKKVTILFLLITGTYGQNLLALNDNQPQKATATAPTSSNLHAPTNIPSLIVQSERLSELGSKLGDDFDGLVGAAWAIAPIFLHDADRLLLGSLVHQVQEESAKVQNAALRSENNARDEAAQNSLFRLWILTRNSQDTFNGIAYSYDGRLKRGGNDPLSEFHKTKFKQFRDDVSNTYASIRKLVEEQLKKAPPIDVPQDIKNKVASLQFKLQQIPNRGVRSIIEEFNGALETGYSSPTDALNKTDAKYTVDQFRVWALIHQLKGTSFPDDAPETKSLAESLITDLEKIAPGLHLQGK